jgi:hypothetical protein
VKKYSFGLFPLALFCTFLFSLIACRKINESTELGYDLIPPIDNITTFDTSLAVLTDNMLFNDTGDVDFADDLAIGTINNDPEFGSTKADAYFTIRPIVFGGLPFLDRDVDSFEVDSVVLQLAYKGAFGDTITPQTFNVYRIANNSDFHDTAFYKYDHPDFAIDPTLLGSKTFSFNQLNDSVPVIRKGDTTKVGNVLRITLNSSLGDTLHGFDTTGYKTDLAFKSLFKGLAIKTNGSGNGLGYFSMADFETKLTVYYTAQVDGKDSSAKTDFVHMYVQPSNGVKKTSPVNYQNGQANIIRRTNGGNYQTYLTNATAEDDRLYIQSMPGSAGHIKIPALSSLPNSVVHRAELIMYKVPSAMENIFTAPSRLFLDKISNAGDTAYVFQKDLYNSSGTLQYEIFGGLADRNNVYKFNITRYVQGIVSNKERNLTLRVYAPVRTELYFPHDTATQKTSYIYQIINQPANGRIVLAGGNFPDPSVRMHLRIIYSKL